MQKDEYAAYLRTATWQGKRQLALEAAGGACQLCNRTTTLHVHHRTYERVGGDELVSDLTVLCETCHNHFHRGLTVLGGKKKQAKAKKKKSHPGARRRPYSPKDKEGRDKVYDFLDQFPPGEIFTTDGVSTVTRLSRGRAGGHLAELHRRKELVERVGKKRWRLRGTKKERDEAQELDEALDRLLALPDARRVA